MKLRLFNSDLAEKNRVGDIVHRYEHQRKEEISNQIEKAQSAYDKREALKKPAQRHCRSD
ncbi:MAG: hypothetical protein AAF443_08060 [Chlamydiota bacterium]